MLMLLLVLVLSILFLLDDNASIGAVLMVKWDCDIIHAKMNQQIVNL